MKTTSDRFSIFSSYGASEFPLVLLMMVNIYIFFLFLTMLSFLLLYTILFSLICTPYLSSTLYILYELFLKILKQNKSKFRNQMSLKELSDTFGIEINIRQNDTKQDFPYLPPNFDINKVRPNGVSQNYGIVLHLD